MRSVSRYKVEEKTPRRIKDKHRGSGRESDASSTRHARKKSKAELSQSDVSDEESADDSDFNDVQSGITAGTLNNLDLEITGSTFPSRENLFLI